MNTVFYIAAILAIISTVKVISGMNAVHALLYLISSLLSVAVIFFVLGAPFVAALEVIIYAGAIMVLFVFVVMMLNIGKSEQKQENELLKPKTWIGPSIISLILLFAMGYLLLNNGFNATEFRDITPREVGELLFSKYILIVDLAAFLLMAGIIGAYHLGRKEKVVHHRYLENENIDS